MTTRPPPVEPVGSLSLPSIHGAAAGTSNWSESHHSSQGTGLRLSEQGVQLAVWELPEGQAPTLHTDGSAPLWLVAIDGSQHLINMERLAAQTGEYLIATGSRVAVAVSKDAADQGVAGWHAGTRLCQIASQTLLADGLVVRPQSPVGVAHRRSAHASRHTREVSVTTGAQMIDRNWTQGAAGRAHRGWIETHMPGGWEAVTVRLVADGEDDDSAVAAPPALWIHHGPAGTPQSTWVTTTVADYQGGGRDAVWRFILPNRTGADGQTVIRAAAPEGSRLRRTVLLG